MLPYPQAQEYQHKEKDEAKCNSSLQYGVKPAILKIIVEDKTDANPAYPSYNHPDAPKRQSVFCFRTIKKPKRLPLLWNWDDK